MLRNVIRKTLLAVIATLTIASATPTDAAVANRQILQEGDVLLGINWEDFSSRLKFPYYYGGIRHAAVWNGSDVNEGGVAWDFDEWWPRGDIDSAALDAFVSRYDMVIVMRSNRIDGNMLAQWARLLEYYWGGGKERLSCVEFVEYAHAFAQYYAGNGWRFRRYTTPRGIYDSSDFQYIGFVYDN